MPKIDKRGTFLKTFKNLTENEQNCKNRSNTVITIVLLHSRKLVFIFWWRKG